jgi:hypothetical protein
MKKGLLMKDVQSTALVLFSPISELLLTVTKLEGV